MVTHCVGEVNNMTSQGVAASGGGTGSPAASPSPTQIDISSTTIQPQQRRTNENRRSNKPIMEKRRRARINNCLNELKSLILDAMKKDPARHSKLEKADILEMTVKHLENMQRQQIAMSAATDPQVLNKFRAGFSECAGEVGRFPGLEPPVRRRLLQHLANVLNTSAGTESVNINNNNNTNNSNNNVSIQTGGQALSTGTPTVQSAGVQVHILPASDSPQSGILFSTTTTGGGLQLVPTRLPNGDIALVLPSTSARPLTTPSLPNSQTNSSTNKTVSTSPLPMLIPIPSRTSSASSSTSSVQSELSTISSASQTTISTSTNTSTSPISFERLTVSTTPSPQPQSPPLNHPQLSPQHPQLSPQLPQLSPQHYQHQNHFYIQNHSPVIRNTPENIEQNHYTTVENYHQIPTTVSTTMVPVHENQIPRNYIPQSQADPKPLSLVIKKRYQEVIDEEKPWRPW